MKKVLTTILIFATCIQLYGQKTFVPADRRYSIYIKTESNSVNLGNMLQNAVAMEITRELSCVTVNTLSWPRE